MAGRRIRWGRLVISEPLWLTLMYRGAIREELISSGILSTDAYVVVAGPANTYAHYVTTPEEYDVQRYEGASTIFGRCKRTFFGDIYQR